MREIELKIKLDNPDKFEKSIKSNSKIIRVDIMKDVYFDFEILNFKKDDRVLRLRKQTDLCYIAYKSPRVRSENLIVRDEFETKILDFDIGYKIITSLGFVPVEIVEKERKEILNYHFPKLKILIDKLPFIGSYLELEGVELDILNFSDKFNINKTHSETRNYTEIFHDFCRLHKIELQNLRTQFTFEDEKLYYKNIRGEL